MVDIESYSELLIFCMLVVFDVLAVIISVTYVFWSTYENTLVGMTILATAILLTTLIDRLWS